MSKGLYDPKAHPPLATKWLTEGSTRQAVAEKIGISYQTFRNWCKKHTEFDEAVKLGAYLADEVVVSALYRSAIGFTEDGKYFPPNPTSICFWLKNRRPDEWRDRREVEAKVQLSDLSEDELKNRILGLLENE